MATQPHWKEEPDDHDYPAAYSYLSLLLPPLEAKKVVKRLRRRPIEHFKAKDLLRSSRLELLGPDNVHVARDLAEVKRGQRLSPVLLLRGFLPADIPLTVADGYHRICASYHLDEDADIPCRIIL
jgi:hypothetical protein